MTIGIGVLASDKSKPDTIILLADTKGSFGTSHSMNRLHKIFKNDELKVYAVAADRIDRAAELFTILQNMLRPPSPFSKGGYSDIRDAISAASDIYKRARFRYDVLPQHARTFLHLPEPFTEADLTPQLVDEWRNFYFRCQMIVGGITKDGQACLFHVDGKGGIENFTFPGFAAIGSGSPGAMLWLSYRNHHLGKSVKHSAYHGFEAKLMGESSPFVNDKTEMLVANKDGSFELNDFKSTPKGVPFTLAQLRKMFAKYGPKPTDDLTKE